MMLWLKAPRDLRGENHAAAVDCGERAVGR